MSETVVSPASEPEATPPVPSSSDASITHPLQALPDMAAEPAWHKDPVIIIMLVFAVCWVLALIIGAFFHYLVGPLMDSLATVHVTSAGIVGGNRAMSRLPYSNAAKQPMPQP